MNIVSVLNKLKSVNMVSSSEEGEALFFDCFNKFGISILLLNDENKFNQIIELLVNNRIPLQKANGIYNLRIFAVDVMELEKIVQEFSSINEIDFLRRHPEYISQLKNISEILKNMKRFQNDGISYKNDNNYNISLLLNAGEAEKVKVSSVNEYLKSVLEDTSLVDKVVNNIANQGEEDFNVALGLQKVENKICEEYLFPADDGWKIIINNKEINSYQNIKETINLITKLNIPITYQDAFIFVLFYKTPLDVPEIDTIIRNVLQQGGM